MVLHDLYEKSKTALTAEEREQARKEYLDRRGVRESFRLIRTGVWHAPVPVEQEKTYRQNRNCCGRKNTYLTKERDTVIRHGDYLIPCLTLLEEEQRHIGVWGQRHLRYLKEYRKAIYRNMLISGRLNRYLADIDERAEDMFSRLVKEYADRQGITEQLKAENQLEWVGRMNNIRACVREVVEQEIIYI